jgi:hypothetical protein
MHRPWVCNLLCPVALARFGSQFLSLDWQYASVLSMPLGIANDYRSFPKTTQIVVSKRVT